MAHGILMEYQDNIKYLVLNQKKNADNSLNMESSLTT